MNKADLSRLFAYTRWANTRALEAAVKLSAEDLVRDVGSSFPSVFKTLEHMLAAEWVWLKRLNGVSPAAMFDGHECKTLFELRERWDINDLEWTAFIEAMSEDDLLREINYTNLAGDKLVFPQGRIMQHVTNHATYHRGQIVTILRQLGAGAFESDILFFSES
jgi:uncharacterized damage-inducible protein DinB